METHIVFLVSNIIHSGSFVKEKNPNVKKISNTQTVFYYCESSTDAFFDRDNSGDSEGEKCRNLDIESLVSRRVAS